MGKVVNISSLFEENALDYKINTLRKELQNEALSPKKLTEITDELEALFLYIKDTLEQDEHVTSLMLERLAQKKIDIGGLINICHHRWLDRRIEVLADEVNELSEDKKTSEKINLLKDNLNQLTTQEGLTLENRYLVQKARESLNTSSEPKLAKASLIRKEFQNNFENRDPVDDYENSLLLYELAGHLYYQRLNKAKESYFSLPLDLRDRLETQYYFHLPSLLTLTQIHALSEKLEDSVKVLVGFANQIMMGENHIHLPNSEEIEAIFSDELFDSEEARDIS